jgi:hypothetical protein
MSDPPISERDALLSLLLNQFDTAIEIDRQLLLLRSTIAGLTRGDTEDAHRNLMEAYDSNGVNASLRAGLEKLKAWMEASRV